MSPPPAAPQAAGIAGDRPLHGIAATVAAMATFAVVDGLAKWLVADASIFQVVAIRSAIVLALVCPIVLRAGGPAALATRRPYWHAARAALAMLSILLYFESLRHLPLATASVLGSSAPLFMTALSTPLLGERVGIHRWIAVIVGFIGVVVVAQPGGEVADTRAAAMAVASGLTYALSMIAMRWLTPTESDASFVVYNNLGTLLIGAAALPFVWSPPPAVDLALTAAMGGAMVLGQLLMVRAFRLAPVSVVAPFHYSDLVWAAAIGFVVWGDFPGPQVWTGAAIVVASGVYVVLREERTSARP